MRVYYQWLEFPVGNRAYGAGGWSRGAKCRPAPEIKEGVAEATQSGKSWVVGGVRKLKCNLWDLATGEQLRKDYPDLAKPASLDDALLRAMKGVLP